jgi:hypothetical protein
MNESTIVTVHKHEKNFTIISNDVLRDSRITLEARGLLCNLLSNADGWHISVGAIVKYIYDPKLLGIMKTGHGKTQIYRIFKELIEAGYMTRERVYEDGKVKEWRYTVYEQPVGTEIAKPTSGKPKNRKPKNRKPTNRKQGHLRNTNSEEGPRIKEEQAPTAPHYANMQAQETLNQLPEPIQAIAEAIAEVTARPIGDSTISNAHGVFGYDGTADDVRRMFSGSSSFWYNTGPGSWKDGGQPFESQIVSFWQRAKEWHNSEAATVAAQVSEAPALYEQYIEPCKGQPLDVVRSIMSDAPQVVRDAVKAARVKGLAQSVTRLDLEGFQQAMGASVA